MLALPCVRGHTSFPLGRNRILYAQDNLTFHALELSNPAPLGRQILEAAGAKPVEDLQPARHLPMANLRKYRCTNPLTLRKRGVERFRRLRYRPTLQTNVDGRQLEWGKPAIKGLTCINWAMWPKNRAGVPEVA